MATDETWATRREAAIDLAVILNEPITAGTLAMWSRDPACPLPHGRGAIDRQALTIWAQTVRRKPGGAARHPDEDAEQADLRVRLLQEQVRNLDLKNQSLADESVNAEEVRVGIVRAVEELRRELTQEVPSAAWAVSQGKAVEESVAAIRTMLIDALNRFHESAKRLAP